MKNIILIAPPGAGKGTQAKMLCEKYKMIHISVGDLLRNEIDKNNKLSLILKEEMKKGNLIDDKIILEILKNRFKQEDIKNGFILDGFPRNINQAEKLDLINNQIDAVIYLEVPKEILKQRIIGRLICSNCGYVYNDIIEYMKPLKENICDKCSSILEKRIDDNLNSFENRYITFLNDTQPVLEFYREKGILFNITSLEKDKIFDEITCILSDDV